MELIKERNNNINKIYENFINKINDIKTLILNDNAYIICSNCGKEVSKLDDNNPECNDISYGEYKIKKIWMFNNILNLYSYKGNVKIKKYNINDDEINIFERALSWNRIKYDNLLCCGSGKHLIGYTRNGDNFINYLSKLSILYPDKTIEEINNHDAYFNNFASSKKILCKILKNKNSEIFKSKLYCKLCNFRVTENINEFISHINSDSHKISLSDLKNEFY